MEFDSEEAAYIFYNEYARKMRFSVRKEQVVKNKKTGEVTSRIYSCSKEGYRLKDKRDKLTKNPRAETRTGCEAQMGIKLNRCINKFVVYDFREAHNHALVSKKCAYMLRSQRGVSNEVSPHPRKQQLENPSFFHAIQLDSEEQITNVFWADAKMILDYGQFGDVVSFDTTYRTNKDNCPLGVFVGFNHHREVIIFGAALMYDEMADSFIWLFETFLDAMFGKSPKTIFTDQDAAMAKAISVVMPDTYHRLCIWHIMQNAMKKVNHVFRSRTRVHKVLSKFIDSYEEEYEFLAVWDAMLTEYNVYGDEWFKRIFEVRRKWAYAYVRGQWCARLQTTQISESINGDLKDYLQSDHNLVEFFKHFERVVNDKRYKELEAEYALCQKIPQVQRPIKMLIEAGNVYTKIIFEEFQNEFVSALDFYIKTTVDTREDIVYTVGDLDTSKEFRVIRKKSDNYVSCCCKLFEMNGVLCGHAIKILREVMNVKVIPSEYILNRWTRKARSNSVKDMHGRDIQVDTKLQQTTWYRSLCSIFTKISSWGAESKETYEVAFEHANKLRTTIEEMLSSKRDGTSHEKDDQGSAPITKDTCVQAKGFKKRGGSRGRKRQTSQLERAYMRKLAQMRQLLGKKGCSDVDVQENGSKTGRQASGGRKNSETTSRPAQSSKEVIANISTDNVADVQANGSKRRRQASRGRKSTKTTSQTSPSSKDVGKVDNLIQQASQQQPTGHLESEHVQALNKTVGV
uniref:protein FAR1-RELATED SEQUENCE 5-like n=1 Tax=Fragaria vesca subsp. vesca TaxID=101020 RepID=UPI0005C82448|nr:PREDICTED: protein FAR1-RELATED SEQUENCE 5-like [Fragaria vesca subsp. vesca]